MLPQNSDIEVFKYRLRESLHTANLNFTDVRIPKHRNVYICGDISDSVHFIESGQVKLLMLSPEGKECLLSIHTAGDMFGELCLTGSDSRRETATAMEDTVLKRIPCHSFFMHLTQNSLLEGFVQYLATRVAEQQQIIASLIMADSERRLGKTLLLLAQKLGKRDPGNTRIAQKITHEELSEMVGTTRPRITLFLRKFRCLGLVHTTPEHFLIIDEKKLAAYLTGLA